MDRQGEEWLVNCEEKKMMSLALVEKQLLDRLGSSSTGVQRHVGRRRTAETDQNVPGNTKADSLAAVPFAAGLYMATSYAARLSNFRGASLRPGRECPNLAAQDRISAFEGGSRYLNARVTGRIT
jgi:hypothetical protein